MKASTGAGAERIETAIRRRVARGHPALAAFLTAGYPTPAGFADLLNSVAGAADVVEVGVPFTDPLADGVTIQDSSRLALENGVTLPWILEMLATALPTTPLVLMSYLNPLIAYGTERLASDSAQAGVAGFIVPDLPFEESEPLRSQLERHGLALIQLVAPVTTPPRLDRIAAASQGFVYAVTMTGTTGGAAEPTPSVTAYLDRVRDVAPVPVLAGFGIRSRAQVEAIAQHADGVVVGSALIDALSRGLDPVTFLESLRS